MTWFGLKLFLNVKKITKYKELFNIVIKPGL